MATNFKVLGQSAPSATTEDDLYAPSSAQGVASSLVVCNRGGTSTTFRVSVSVGGGATANTDYIYYDVPISANNTFIATVGLTIADTDVVRVYAGNANLTFSLYGSEIT